MVMTCYVITFALIGEVGWPQHGLGVAVALAGYHFTLIRDREPAQCFKAFLHNNWIGATIFAGIALDFLFSQGALQ